MQIGVDSFAAAISDPATGLTLEVPVTDKGVYCELANAASCKPFRNVRITQEKVGGTSSTEGLDKPLNRS